MSPLLRSILFFPGSRPELYRKALDSGADAVCLDLEDAVAPEEKPRARRSAVELLASGGRGEAPRDGTATLPLVRVNDPASEEGELDLRELLDSRARIGGVVIPKASTADQVRRVSERLDTSLPEALLLPIIETAAGLEAVSEIARATPSVAALVFGGVDLGRELGADGSWESLLYARSRIVHGAATAGIPAVDMPFMDLSRPSALEEECQRARALGFVGKLAVHPGQVEPLQRCFSPTMEEVEWARRVTTAGPGASLVDGSVVDRPVVERARRILQLADQVRTGG